MKNKKISEGKVISLVGTKGGILKSTLTQCISTSKAFESYDIIILEGDSQNSLSSWINEREAKMKPLNIKIVNHDEDVSLKSEIDLYKKKCDFLFVDLPGESKALTLTRTAFACSDLCIFPLRLSHKDTTAFDQNMREPLMKILQIRDKKHFKVLPTFAHHSTNIDNFRENYESIKVIDKFTNVHKDRNVYTYFTIGGLTLREYKSKNRFNLIESAKAAKAIHDIELISKEIIQKI